MGSLDDWLPRYDVRKRHELGLPVEPERALAALLETRAGCDRLTRTLFALRGLRGGALPLGSVFSGMGFEVLERDERSLVGATGRPWRPLGGLAPFAAAAPSTVRIAADFRAEPAAGGSSVLSTETRVAALDNKARRAFRAYWFLVGPFSGLIRRRWLAAAAARAIASAKSSVGLSPPIER